MTNPETLTRISARSYHSPITASISLPALAHNLSALRSLLPAGCEILAIVKADAYGHGATIIAQALCSLGILRLGVATVQEGVALRDHGIQIPIVILGGMFPWQLPALVDYRLTPILSDEEVVLELAEYLGSHSKPFPVHLKVDTGMRRLGLSPESALNILRSPSFTSVFQLEGMMTHLADADNPDPEFTNHQLQTFREFAQRCQHDGISIPFLHTANTAGILLHPSAHFNMVRPGLMLYGYAPKIAKGPEPSLKPVMRITTKILQIRTVTAGEPLSYNRTYRTTRPSRIGILPIGYAHGYSRHLSNKGVVLVGNQRVPVVGNICMDMTLIDITDCPGVKVGEEVVILGKQGSGEITAADIATWQETVPYEVLCAIGPRINRIYEPLPPTPQPGRTN